MGCCLPPPRKIIPKVHYLQGRSALEYSLLPTLTCQQRRIQKYETSPSLLRAVLPSQFRLRLVRAQAKSSQAAKAKKLQARDDSALLMAPAAAPGGGSGSRLKFVKPKKT
eukprot:1184717-Prorocentrum_minimum.AAC.1